MKRRSFLGVTLPLAMTGPATAAPAPAETPMLAFGVIADPQYADKAPNGTRFYRNSIGKLKEAISSLNRESLAFVVTLGDLIDTDIKSFDVVMPLYDELRAPHYPICGNHDFEVDDAEKTKVLTSMRLEKSHYSKVIKSWRFIFLDGTDFGVWRHAANDPLTKESEAWLKDIAAEGKPQAKPYNAGIGLLQLAWLEAELQAAKKADQRVVIFNHYPVIPSGDPHNLWNAEDVVALIDRYDHVVAYMNGHNHAGNFETHRHCHFVNFKGMVETESSTAYGVVRCFADRLEIIGHGIEPDRSLGSK